MSSNAQAKGMPASQRLAIDSREVLTTRHFQITIGIALLLHVAAVYVWYLVPKQQVIDIPVRALNIKLSDGDLMTPEDTKAVSQQENGNTAEVESTITKLVRDQNVPVPATRPQAPATSAEKVMSALDKAMKNSEAANARAPNVPRQFVRDSAVSVKAQATGNSNAKDAEIMSRYEQMISLWIQKFKVYPADAKAKGLTGSTMIRIRIDRGGDMRYYALERSTGQQMLDRAAIEMIRRANPLPPVPKNYPPGDLLEFLVPVNFN